MQRLLNMSACRFAGMAFLAVAATLFAAAPACLAQSNTTPAESAAPAESSVQTAPQPGTNSAVVPARPRIRVERLSLVEGTVHVLRGDHTQFPQAAMNMPLTQGMKVETGSDGRAEIEFEDGSVARITPNSSLTLASLQAPLHTALETTTVEQNSGLIYYELRSDPRTQFHVNFNGRTATPVANSTFRIDLNNSPKDLGVLDGKVRVNGASDSYSVEVLQGKTIQFATSGNEPYTVANWLAPNGFDDWNQQLDQEAAQQAKNQTPARVQQGGGSIMDTAAYGWSDLDSSGSWYPLPGYGMVWQPNGAGPGFNPYGYGSWAFYGGGVGYTWISGYPWGWLPFNCGAWNYIGSFGWGWTPGMYGCGGFGIGFGYGYGYGGYPYAGRGHRGRHGHHPHCNIDRAPPGYRAPTPPRIAKGQMPERLVHVGTRPRGMAMRIARLDSGSRLSGHSGRAVKFNGDKISPLQAMNRSVSFHNAALYNNRSAHAFSGHGTGLSGNRMLADGGRDGMRGRPASIERSMNRSLEGVRGRNFHAVHGASRSEHALGGHDRAAFDRQAALGGHATFGARSSFGSHTSFGPGGSFGGRRSAFAGAGFHNGFRGASGMGRPAGFAGGGFHGSAAHSGGFHGGGGSHSSSGGGGGFHGGGGFSGGAGGHAGGGGGGGSHSR